MSKSPTNNHHVAELFDQFINGTTLKSVLTTFRRICQLLDLEPGPFNQFYPTLKKGIACNKNWKSQSIFSKIEKKAYNKIYHGSGSSSGRASVGIPHGHGSTGNNILKNHNCLVIGAGPCGLRTAIELQLLGSRHVMVIEKRDRFSRNNVLHLWPFVIADLKQLAGKKFYGKFCAGSIDHVSIRQLQLMLLKVALIVGCEFIENITFEEICPYNVKSSREALKETTIPEATDGGLDESGGRHHLRSKGPGLEATSSSSPSKRKLYTTIEEKDNCGTIKEDNGLRCHDDDDDDGKEDHMGRNDYANDDDGLDKDCKENNDDGLSVKYSGINSKNEARRKERSCCVCCCHLHRGRSGRNFWPHIGRNYIGAYAHFSLTSPTPATSSTLVNHELLLEKLHTYPFDILIGGDGRRNTLNDNFPRKEFRGKLAIAITANFINNHTLAEAQVPEISGISFIYHQEMFKSLYDETGIDLENICYYKDDTHYFVMTAKKSSLLQRGVLINDYSDTRALLSPSNIDRSQLLSYARDAAKWTTGLDTPNFALNHYGEADVAMFDFTSMYAADNACRAKRIIRSNYTDGCSRCNCDNEPCKKQRSDIFAPSQPEELAASPGGDVHDEGLLLVSLVGDSLLEPFWPTGSGCGRGFLSAMDAAWMARQWAVKRCKSIKDEDKILSVLSEREAIYRLLAQTKSENLSQNCASYSINPVTRYPNLNSSTLLPHQCRHLLYDHIAPPMVESRTKLTMAEKRARRATIATTSPFSGGVIESRQRVEREFMAISKEKEMKSRSNSHRQHKEEDLIGQEYEESLAAFEENYRGLMNSDEPSSVTGSVAPLSSSVPDDSSHQTPCSFVDLALTPSANNLLTIGKSRARDIESAFRHRRQRQSFLKRSSEDDPASRVHQKAQLQCINHLRQQLRSKAAWFLDQKSENNDCERGGQVSGIKRESFSERIKDLEAKLYAASGISYLSDENSDHKEEVRLPSTRTGINVMLTATQLQQLLNPKLQEEKLRNEAKLKANKDIKFVGKISKEDWNVKPFEGSIEDKVAPQVKPKSPPPPQRVELFRNKLNDIQNKLEHIDDHHLPERRLKELKEGGGGNISTGEWISMLKNELNEKVTKKTEVEPEKKNISSNTTDGIAFRKESRRGESTTNSNSSGPGRLGSSKCCSKCGNIVATVDKILVSGTLFHRSCLKCIKCGVTLRMSEVRNTGNGSLASLITSSTLMTPKDNDFNYKCSNCTKNVSNTGRTTTRTNLADRMTNSLEGNLEAAKSLPPTSKVTTTPVGVPAPVSDDYEARLRERMKWKEMFLLNNNNIDLSGIGNKTSELKAEEEDEDEKKKKRQESKNNLLNERIEYENISMSSEMVDDDELTKLLNLGSDRWESEGEEEDNEEEDSNEDDKEEGQEGEDEDEDESSSESWEATDSTDNDFDSDQFDESGVSDGDFSLLRPLKDPSKAAAEERIVPQIVLVPDDPLERDVDTIKDPKNDKNEANEEEKEEDEGDVESEKTEKNISTKEEKSGGSTDSNTINSKINDIGDGTAPATTTTIEEREFQMICDEMEKKQQQETSSPKLGISEMFTKQTEEKPIEKIDSDDEDSRTSLSSLSINVSDTYDDINLFSVWDETTNCGEASTTKKNCQKSKDKDFREGQRIGGGLFKSKTEASIPDRSPYHNQNARTNEVKLFTTPDKKDKGLQSIMKPPRPPAINQDPQPSFSSSSLMNNGDKSPRAETYSKIPVLAARVIAANEKVKPSYSGSFTEKLLQRCRSSPSIPLIGDSLSRWSSSKMQLSSPTKVLSITKALNAQTTGPSKENSPWPNRSTTFKPQYHQHHQLPFADSESHSHLTENNQHPTATTTITTSLPVTNSHLARNPTSTKATSKYFQAPKATLDEDVFDDEDFGRSYSSSSARPEANSSSPKKGESNENQCKLKPIKINYNY